MYMSVGEIKKNYYEAKNKKRQIVILADLNCCSKEEIEKILGVEKKRESKTSRNDLATEQKKEVSIENVKNKLFSRMDELDRQIKELENEYREIVVAIKVISKMEV